MGGIGRLKERWRWSFVPAGEREQLVLFDHGERGGRADQEVRAAILESAYGRGLYYASDASHGREIGFYDGEVVTQTTLHTVDDLHLECGPLCVHSVLGVGLTTFSQ